jgi:hypothetical protein
MQKPVLYSADTSSVGLSVDLPMITRSDLRSIGLGIPVCTTNSANDQLDPNSEELVSLPSLADLASLTSNRSSVPAVAEDLPISNLHLSPPLLILHEIWRREGFPWVKIGPLGRVLELGRSRMSFQLQLLYLYGFPVNPASMTPHTVQSRQRLAMQGLVQMPIMKDITFQVYM